MKKHLILVKHSLPKIVESIPAREWNLSVEGRIRARRLAKQLIPFQPEVILSSIEPKAQETAEIIASRYDLALHIVNGLHEHDRSKMPYLSKNDFQAAIREVFTKPDILIFGSETADQAHMRFSQAVNSVLRYHANQTVVIVTHGTVLSLFVSRLTGISDLLLWAELGMPSYVVLDLKSKILIARENIV